MNKFLASALGLGLLMAAPASLSAQPSGRPQEQSRDHRDQRHQAGQRGQQTPAPKQTERAPARPPQMSPQRDNARPSQNAHGSWNSEWGARPSDPPKHFSRKGDWYRHVRACQQKFRSYNSRTDTYRTQGGQARRCTL